jgi:hypothetical protein
VQRRVDIGRPGGDAGREHRHVDEGRPDIDVDPTPGALDQCPRGGDVDGIERMRHEHAVSMPEIPLIVNRPDDSPGLLDGAGREVDVIQHAVVPRALVSNQAPDATATDDQNVALHGGGSSFLGHAPDDAAWRMLCPPRSP